MTSIIAIITETMEVICIDSLNGQEKEKIQLNFSEYRMLAFLLKNESSISNRSQLLEEGWPGKFVTENSLNVSMMKLRKKVDDLHCDIQIKTFLGKGYKLLYPKDEKLVLFDTYNEFLESIHVSDRVEENHDILNEKESVTKAKFLVKGIKSPKLTFLDNLSPVNRMVLLGGVSLLITLFIFFNLYSDSFTDFDCDKQEICSFIKHSDV